jgi:hypothetical protein
LGYRAGVADEDAVANDMEAGGIDELESVVVRPNPFSEIGRAMTSTTGLALTALIVATAALLSMSVANDIAGAKLYSHRGFDTLAEIRWSAGTRLVVAGVALLIAIVAGVRYSRGLPATRYTFSPDGQDATESTDGVDAPGWVTMLVGSSVAVSVLAIVLNAIALVTALRLHESPNFGVPN